jgi:hypothetical protein
MVVLLVGLVSLGAVDLTVNVVVMVLKAASVLVIYKDTGSEYLVAAPAATPKKETQSAVAFLFNVGDATAGEVSWQLAKLRRNQVLQRLGTYREDRDR